MCNHLPTSFSSKTRLKTNTSILLCRVHCKLCTWSSFIFLLLFVAVLYRLSSTSAVYSLERLVSETPRYQSFDLTSTAKVAKYKSARKPSWVSDSVKATVCCIKLNCTHASHHAAETYSAVGESRSLQTCSNCREPSSLSQFLLRFKNSTNLPFDLATPHC